jgi:hypothetical protein
MLDSSISSKLFSLLIQCYYTGKNLHQTNFMYTLEVTYLCFGINSSTIAQQQTNDVNISYSTCDVKNRLPSLYNYTDKNFCIHYINFSFNFLGLNVDF